jgi:inhibitor of KinA
MYRGIDPIIYQLGDSSLEVSFGDTIDASTHQRVITLWHSLKESPLPGQGDTTPAYSTLAIHFDRIYFHEKGLNRLISLLSDRIGALSVQQPSESNIIQVPVCYESDFAPDLQAVSDQLQLPVDSIIELHSGCIYTVFLLGFLPGFPYLGPLPQSLHLPRNQRPESVTAGTVAMAANQTGIYPSNSPGGWWRIGRTPLPLFDPADPRIVLFEPGDRVRFYSITKNQFSSIATSARETSISTLREKGGW